MFPKPQSLYRYVYGAILASGVTHAKVRLLKIQQSAYPELPNNCVAVLNEQVPCDPWLKTIGTGERLRGIKHFLDEQDVETLCTDECAAGLDRWARRVARSCDGARFEARGASVAPDVWPQKYLEAFDSACLVDQDGGFCMPVLASIMGINPENQQPTADPDPSAPCNSCYLSLFQTQLAMPLAYTTDLETAFTMLTSSCSETGFTLPTRASNDWIQTPTTDTNETPEPTPTCDGATYEISPGETCESISTAASISTQRLLLENNLWSFCYKFPTSGTLCIPSDATCTPYTVQEGDTCASIAKDHDKTYIQVLSWNPELGRNCRNIKSYTGLVICVSSPAGEWVNRRPIDRSSSTSTRKTFNLDGMTPIKQMPLATRPPGNSITIVDWAPGTREDCLAYHIGGALLSADSRSTSAACGDVAAHYGVTVEELLGWNPSLEEDSTCVLRDDAQYCVGMVKVVDEGMTDACVQTAAPRAGDSCRTFFIRFGLSDRQFTAWNPVVGGDCGDFNLGSAYCVEVEHFRAPGIAPNCNQFVIAEETRWFMDPCGILEAKYGLSHELFVAWNPDVGQSCTAVFPGYDYCVSIPNYQPTFSSSATASEELLQQPPVR